MNTILFILNDAPYGSERPYNALRLAGALALHDKARVRLFLMGDAVGCAKSGQRVPEGFYNASLLLDKVIQHGEVALCGSCMDARGLDEAQLLPGATRSNLAQLADWTVEADKVLVF